MRNILILKVVNSIIQHYYEIKRYFFPVYNSLRYDTLWNVNRRTRMRHRLWKRKRSRLFAPTQSQFSRSSYAKFANDIAVSANFRSRWSATSSGFVDIWGECFNRERNKKKRENTKRKRGKKRITLVRENSNTRYAFAMGRCFRPVRPHPASARVFRRERVSLRSRAIYRAYSSRTYRKSFIFFLSLSLSYWRARWKLDDTFRYAEQTVAAIVLRCRARIVANATILVGALEARRGAATTWVLT